jgi:L-malate glycosyltransferase
MRICYVSHSTAHFTAPYVDWFAGRGHEVHLVSLCRQDLENAINHHPWKGEFEPMGASWAYLWAIPGVRRAIRRIAPDIVHAHYVSSNGMMAAAAGVHPLVITAHGSDIHLALSHPVRRRAVRYALKRADLVNPVSRDLERKIAGLGLRRDRIFRSTLGIETKRFLSSKGPRRPGPCRIICTRWLLPVYQCDLIIRAAGLLAREGVEFELVFAASGSRQPDLVREVERLGLNDRVRFLGGFQPSDLPSLLADADIYVSASSTDGTSISLLEALAAGAFPVVTDIVANREWIDGNVDGLLFDVRSERGLAACLERAITDDALRAGAVEINRERVLAEGDRDVNMTRLAACYERLIS